MSKTGTIKHIDPNGEWNGLKKYKITFADGTQYTFFAKGTFKRNIGDNVRFKVTNEEYKNASLLPDAPMSSTNFVGSKPQSKDLLIIKQTCIKAAAEFNAQRAVDSEQVIQDAVKFLNWITNE